MKGKTVLFCIALPAFFFGCYADRAPQKRLSESFEVGKRLTYEEQQGKHLFDKYCSICHGESGKGDGFNAFNLEPRPRDLTDANYMKVYSKERLAEVIIQGGRGINKSVYMPAWGNTLRPYQVDYLVEFVRMLSRNE